MTVSFEPFIAASAPPKAPETTIGGPSVTPWVEWAKKSSTHFTPKNWTFCKFGVRGASEEECGEVFGIVRDGFGAYWCRFLVSVPDQGFHGEQFLAVGIETRSGYAFGVFGNIQIAVEAAEIAMRISARNRLTPDEGPDGYLVLGEALGAAGYTPAHAQCRPMHHGEVVPGPAIPVWTRPDLQPKPDGVVAS